MLKPGHLEFKVVHNFGDIGGTFGGVKKRVRPRQLDRYQDRLPAGHHQNFNLIVSRNKGFGNVTQPGRWVSNTLHAADGK